MNAAAWVELAALALAIWAVVRSVPRPPKLDWERLFKVALATVVRGEVEAAGGDAAAWEERLLALVPYHPAGRRADDKLARPDPDALPVPALEGERALVEALAVLDGPAARWRHLAAGDGRGLDALMADPAVLGADYDPARVLGPGLCWDEVARWSDALVAGLRRRLGHVTVVGLGVGPEWAAPLGARFLDLEGLAQGVEVPAPDQDAPPQAQALAGAMLAALADPADRIVAVAAGRHAFSVLVALRASPVLRDRVLAVVADGGDLQGGDKDAWLAEQFQHEKVDPELMRAIAYLSVVRVDPDDPLARPWRDQRFPDPPPPPSGRRAIDPLDLGPLPVHGPDPALVARAVWVVLAFRLA